MHISIDEKLTFSLKKKNINKAFCQDEQLNKRLHYLDQNPSYRCFYDSAIYCCNQDYASFLLLDGAEPLPRLLISAKITFVSPFYTFRYETKYNMIILSRVHLISGNNIRSYCGSVVNKFNNFPQNNRRANFFFLRFFFS